MCGVAVEGLGARWICWFKVLSLRVSRRCSVILEDSVCCSRISDSRRRSCSMGTESRFSFSALTAYAVEGEVFRVFQRCYYAG